MRRVCAISFLFFTTLLAICFFSLIPSARGQSTQFNQNYLISDDEMQNSESMSREDIQAFLDDHGSALSALLLDDASNTRRNVSDIIFRAATTHRINPKYLLVKLQKEQSLITDHAPSQKQLDWATGFGVCDSCSLSDPSIQHFRGFGTQVDSAAAVIRWYYDNISRYPWIRRPNVTYTIDQTPIVPLTFATAFLYTYTPHLLGNQNFWNVWQKWFHQIYPDGTLLKAETDPTVYVIQNGKKRPFANMTALVTREDPKRIITIPSSELARYDAGAPIRLANYSILEDGQKYYLLNNLQIRPFENADTVRQLGYNPDEIISVTTTELADFAIGNPIVATNTEPFGSIIRVKENQRAYYENGSVYQPILDDQMIRVNFPSLSVRDASLLELASGTLGAPMLFKDGTLIGDKTTHQMYVIENGLKRRIAGIDAFIGLGYRESNILWTDPLTILAHPTGEPLSPPDDSEHANAVDTSDDAPIHPSHADDRMQTIPKRKYRFIGEPIETPIQSYLIATDAGRILAGKNVDTLRPIASLVKLMTAHRLLQSHLSMDRDSVVERSDRTRNNENDPFPLAIGERARNKDLFLAMLVSNQNTPTRMLVRALHMPQKQFVARMNAEVRTWGFRKTFFADATGESEKNKSTARELLTLFLKTTRTPDMLATIGTPYYSYEETKDTDARSYHFDAQNVAFVRKTSLPFTVVGATSGYSERAGAVLAMEIERHSDKKKFIIITLGNPDYLSRFDEPERIARWTMESF